MRIGEDPIRSRDYLTQKVTSIIIYPFVKGSKYEVSYFKELKTTAMNTNEPQLVWPHTITHACRSQTLCVPLLKQSEYNSATVT